MKILDEKLDQKFNDTFCTKKITVLRDGNFNPIENYIALYKNKRMIGIVTDVNNPTTSTPTIYSVSMLDRSSKFGLFNVNEGKMIYKGNTKPRLTENGFELTQVVRVTSQYSFSGKLNHSKKQRML